MYQRIVKNHKPNKKNLRNQKNITPHQKFIIFIYALKIYFAINNKSWGFLIISELNSFRRKYGTSLIRAFITGFDNFLVYFFNKTPSRGPLHIGWDITFKCNFSCGYSSVHKMVDQNKKELSTEEAINFVREAGKIGVWILSITGGEPLLRPDLPIIIKEAKKAGLNVNINTNASLLKQRAQEIIDSGIDAITISVESHNPEIHDEIRTRNSFQKILDAIAEIKKLRKNEKPHIMVRSVISKKNYKILNEFITYWKQYTDDIIIQPVHQGYDTSFFIPQNDTLKFQKEDEADFKNVYEQVLKKEKILNNEYYKEIPNFIFNPTEQPKKYRCFVSFFELVIDSYGDVHSCTEFVRNFGNLRNNSLMDVWSNNVDIKKFRELIKCGKQGCWCWYNCTGPFHIYGTKIAKLFRKIK